MREARAATRRITDGRHYQMKRYGNRGPPARSSGPSSQCRRGAGREEIERKLERLRILRDGAHGGQRERERVSSVLVADSDDTRRVLREYGLPSLMRLVPAPPAVRIEVSSGKRGPKYVAVRDEAGLRQLQEAIANCDTCAVDTEASDKDPRRASLFGVAFAVDEGRAFYVPVTAPDLRGTTPEDVLRVLRRVLGGDLKAVAYNLKYDYVLLRRHEIEIKNPQFDTMLAAYDCFGDIPFFNLFAVGCLTERARWTPCRP